MPRKTDGEKIDDLVKLGATLQVQVDRILAELEKSTDKHGKSAEGQADLKERVVILEQLASELKQWREQLGAEQFKTDLAVFMTYVNELRTAKDESTKRRWSFAQGLALALTAAVLTLGGNALIKFLFK